VGLTPFPAIPAAPWQLTIVTGGWHSCAIVRNGSMQCWGDNNVGQLGDGTMNDSAMPVAVVGVSDALLLSASWYHTCALSTDGKVRCWGDNEKGQVGSGNGAVVNTPVLVGGLGGPASDLSVGGAEFAIGSQGYSTGQSCAVIAGHVFCWGDNSFGQLGDGSKTSSPIPVQVVGL
jgi:alpha-tubulin suppressor-like RCC1 family protein